MMAANEYSMYCICCPHDMRKIYFSLFDPTQHELLFCVLRPRKRCVAMAKCSNKLVYVKEEHQEGLMPLPVHIGHWYMREIKDFVLPYDIWWQHSHQQVGSHSHGTPG